MDANFNDFLQGEAFAPDVDERLEPNEAVEEEENRKYATGGVELASSFECHSTHRIPTLYQYALFSFTKVINTLTSSKEQEDQLPTLFANLKEMPEHAKKAILPQLTFTALKKYYGEEIWDLFCSPTQETLPTLLSCMKQEEDMLRYLYEYAPENSHILENQDKILLDVFDDVPSRALVTKKLQCAPDTIICGFNYSKNKNGDSDEDENDEYMDEYAEYSLGPVVDKETFKKNWSEFTYGLLDELDWSNCFAAGGSVLASLRKLPNYDDNTPDIDLYLVGLKKKDAKQKLQHIWDVLQRKIGDRKLHVVKTKNTFTFFADLPFRPVQVITGLYKSATEVLCSFDLDCITVGYNGSQVVALPRFVLSMSTALNFLDSDMNLSNKLQYTRLAKYDERGFSTCLPYTLRNHALGGFDCDLPEDPRIEELPPNVHKLVELMSLAKVVLLSRTLFRFDFARLVSKPIAWNLRWQKGISIGRMRWSLLENDALKRVGETTVSKTYAKLRDLALLTVDELRDFWAEAPRYESLSLRLTDNKWGNAEYHMNVFKGGKLPVATSADEFTPILDKAKFSSYASSMLQCFYLDIIVPCENSGKALTHDEAIESSSPLSYINTSLSRLDYEFYSVAIKFTGLEALWTNKTLEIISEPVRAGKHSWRVKLDAKKDQHVLWVSLIHEENDLVGIYNNESIMKHCFSNFVLKILSTSNRPVDHMNLDGSYIFTYGSKHNVWTTFLLKNYVLPAAKQKKAFGIVDEDYLPHVQEYIRSTSVFINDNGEMNMTLHLQYLTPNVNIVAL
eukprot:TRINITY_DN3729_c0_g1_i1.p1 TRINITY_DN3729_c0_g1~~TRINITY_DN3729_c0_g1_i1.p1  ORF type:complete len:791 (+),score=142.54 TRINITY_DN3729_c0_g1_i1:156-2528(+)